MHAPHAPTPTQYALLCCFLVIGPMMGLLGGALSWSRGRSVPFGVMAATGIAWAGWVVSCVCAVVMFPTYPREAVPPEPIAMTFVVPGLVSGGLALWWLATRAPRDRWSLRTEKLAFAGSALIALLLSVGLVTAHRDATTWPARRHLPAGAAVIDEEILVDDFIGDFTYRIEARMTEAEYVAWMEDLGMLFCGSMSEPHRYCRHGVRAQPTDEHGANGDWTDGIGTFSSWSS